MTGIDEAASSFDAPWHVFTDETAWQPANPKPRRRWRGWHLAMRTESSRNWFMVHESA
jgi:hypothetical protein